jgi:hypothetical protein
LSRQTSDLWPSAESAPNAKHQGCAFLALWVKPDCKHVLSRCDVPAYRQISLYRDWNVIAEGQLLICRGSSIAPTHRKSLQQLVSSINRLVQLLHRMSLIGPSQRQRLIRELPELPNCLHQSVQRGLIVFDSLPQAILHSPALDVDGLPGWRWQLDPCYVFQHPSDLLKVFPGTLARGGLDASNLSSRS